MTLKLKTALIALSAGISLTPLVHAGSPRSVDARTLDIAGVKTGMDYDQALTAVANHFGVAKSQIKADPFPGENIVTRTKLPSYFTYEKNGVKLTVHFEGRVPVDKAHPLVAWQIAYEVPWSAQNKEEMAKAALAKYGVQSNAPNNLPMQWCQEPNRNPGIGCGIGQAKLELRQVELNLTDPTWQTARINFVNDSKATKPSF